MRNYKGLNIINSLLIMVSLALFLSFCTDMTGETLRRPAYFFSVVIMIILAVVFRKSLPKVSVYYVIFGGALVKIAYILYTAVWTRQHDVISFGAGEGHAAYIEYILANKSLPNFDPRLVWGFFQPPLHHTISAAWMWINIRLGIAERQLQENVQVLTLCYMIVTMLVTYYICKELAMKQRGTLITMLIASFHPAYILLSGSINNDALSICFAAVALYIAIIWYKKPNLLSILLLALCIGLGMMAKLSAGLVAPGIGLMMLYKLFADKKNLLRYIIQYVCFAVVVFPIGLWWTIRNKIMWGMPANYIPEVGEQLTSSSLVSRLFDLRTSTVYPCMINNGDAYDEYNFILAMIKTSLFGESNFSQVSSKINVFAVILFITSVVLIIVGIIALVRISFCKEASPAIEYKILLGVSALSIFGAYASFALSYNNFSAQDFRYAALLVSIMAIFTGLWDDRMEAVVTAGKCDESKKKRISIVRNVIFFVSVLFAASSAAVYLLVGLL